MVYANNFPKASGSTPMKGVVIDGIISDAEWSDRDWKVPFHLDIDDAGNPPDTDGYNYIYLGEDKNNLYIGLDLASDQTGDTTGEWISLFLITNNRTFTDYNGWEGYLNNGTESLVYDVENDQVWPFISNTIAGSSQRVNDDSEYNAVFGSVEGSTVELDNIDDVYFNITSELNNGYYINQIDFSIDIVKWIGIFKELFAPTVSRIHFQMIHKVNVTINEHLLYLRYPNGTLNPNDPDQVRVLNTGTSPQLLDFWYNAGNLTTDYRMQYTLFANNTAPFKTQIDMFHLSFYYNMSNYVATVTYPFTSLNTFQIEWSFGPGPDNTSHHRMYELQIPKNELEHYDSEEHLGIIVGGYGTMSFINTNYWVFSEFINYIWEQNSANYKYYNMLGLTIPSGAKIPGYNPLLLLAILGIGAILYFRKKIEFT
ncbi:MAG: hypothetical protein ACFFA3_17805, partial [Promethearchaeota archaeon]